MGAYCSTQCGCNKSRQYGRSKLTRIESNDTYGPILYEKSIEKIVCYWFRKYHYFLTFRGNIEEIIPPELTATVVSLTLDSQIGSPTYEGTWLIPLHLPQTHNVIDINGLALFMLYKMNDDAYDALWKRIVATNTESISKSKDIHQLLFIAAILFKTYQDKKKGRPTRDELKKGLSDFYSWIIENKDDYWVSKKNYQSYMSRWCIEYSKQSSDGISINDFLKIDMFALGRFILETIKTTTITQLFKGLHSPITNEQELLKLIVITSRTYAAVEASKRAPLDRQKLKQKLATMRDWVIASKLDEVITLQTFKEDFPLWLLEYSRQNHNY